MSENKCTCGSPLNHVHGCPGYVSDRPAPSPIKMISIPMKTYKGHLALIEELTLMLEGIIDTDLWKDRGLKHYGALTVLCQNTLAKSRAVVNVNDGRKTP